MHVWCREIAGTALKARRQKAKHLCWERTSDFGRLEDLTYGGKWWTLRQERKSGTGL